MKHKILFGVVIFVLKMKISSSIEWDKIRCSSDNDQSVPDGTVANIGRFPWIGVIQHNFLVGGVMRFAVTSGLLIHPGYAIAAASDMAKIMHDQIGNNTKFILWHSPSVKYALDVLDYILHPEYMEKRTYATIALLELITYGETGVGANPKPVLPICIPVRGAGTFEHIYAVKMADEFGATHLHKELYKMKFVETKECEEFYFKRELDSKMMTPSLPTCAMVERPMDLCVWDNGVALITKLTWGHWSLLGISVRGPGCGAPARFLALYDYLPWINDIISPQPIDEETTLHRFAVRQLSPIEIQIYPAAQRFPSGIGQCEKHRRGSVQYKDAMELTMTRNMGQGFFFVQVYHLSLFTCAEVRMEEFSARSNVAVWIEHYCHREIMGVATGQNRPRDYTKNQCFLYFKSSAFVEFRFYFSFKAVIEMTLYGETRKERRLPYPTNIVTTTESWWPTTKYFRWSEFLTNQWFWHY